MDCMDDYVKAPESQVCLVVGLNLLEAVKDENLTGAR